MKKFLRTQKVGTRRKEKYNKRQKERQQQGKREGRFGDNVRCREWFPKVGQAGGPQVGTVSPTTPLPSLIMVNPRVESAHDNDSSRRSLLRSSAWECADSPFPLLVTPIRKG